MQLKKGESGESGWITIRNKNENEQNCENGTYLDTNNNQCLNCPVGFECKVNLKKQCLDGTYADEKSSSCSICPAGFYCKNGIKKQCENGSYSKEGYSSCITCQEGTILDEKSSSCKRIGLKIQYGYFDDKMSEELKKERLIEKTIFFNSKNHRCSNSEFGSDPYTGKKKKCYINSIAIAKEDESIDFLFYNQCKNFAKDKTCKIYFGKENFISLKDDMTCKIYTSETNGDLKDCTGSFVIE